MKFTKSWAAAAAMVALTGAAQAGPFFGRLANGTASATCTVSGATKCAMFYNPTLDITILNDWNIGQSVWPGAQFLAESAGAAQTDFTGWFLPTGDGREGAGALNQYRSIWNDVGGTYAGLKAQFYGVQFGQIFWSGTVWTPNTAFAFVASDGFQGEDYEGSNYYAVAVRPGDVTASVPEPQTLALALLALGATVVARRRRPR